MMKKFLFMLMILAIVGLTAPANADYYLAGEFNNWDPAGQLMTDNLDGTYSATVSGLTADSRYEFKVTVGDWGTSYPPSNAWLFSDSSGNVDITFNTNVVSDGWQTEQYRIGLNTDPGTWNVVGDLNSWNNADPTLVMTAQGGGIYALTGQTFAAGTYWWKAVRTGTWDAIGANGRGIDASNMELTVAEGETIDFYVDAFAGTVGTGLDIVRIDRPHDPDPDNLQQDVQVAGLELSWTVAQLLSLADPNILVVDPNLVSHKLYINDGITTEPTSVVYVDTITGWDGGTLRASYTPSPELNMDGHYLWRVDMVYDDATEIEGDVWTFDTQLSIPIITADPDYQVVDAGGTANFAVTVSSLSAVTYQWYQYVDGVSDTTLSDVDDDISGATSDTLSIANVELADEGGYYCIVNNDSGVPGQSAQGLLGVKRRIAYWDFESSNANSTVANSPVSFLHGDPSFVTTGIVGDAMEFDNDTGAEDILYTDPDEASYFDICNYNMTVACWIKSSFAAQWGPMVARNGEDGEGWQLRHRGDTLDRICFTTRGTGNEDGTASNRTVYDGNWHYVVGTYDGTVKKVYIDGVLSRVYSGDDGSIAQESDAVSGLINSSPSPVALAGRVKGDPINGLDFEGHSVTPGILDEVEIYNYALDAATIAQTYADIANTVVCPAPQLYDLNDDCVVNLSDLSRLGSEWLSDIRVLPTL